MMKKSFLNLLCIGCVACAFTACSDDDNGIDPAIDGGQSERIEDATIQFKLSQSSPGTYAYVGTDPATVDESDINGSVSVFVFDDQGVYEKSQTLSVTEDTGSSITGGPYIYESQSMTVSSGVKYFYVFANMNTTVIPTPGTGEYRKDFETRVLTNSVIAMTTSGNFYIGTLQPTATTIQADADNTQQVTLQIGRLSAKVLLKEDQPEVKGNLKGTFEFDEAEYRLVNESSEYYLVGQPSSRIGTNGNYMTSPYFTESYSDLISKGYIIPPAAWATQETSPGTHIYTKENTHQNPMNGSATSVQYRVQYTPAPSETYDPATGTNNASLTGGTFWMASVGDLKEKYLFNSDPTGMTDIPNLGDVDDDTVMEYVEGYSYYVIPITDKNETAPAARYSVIRNHSYLITLSTIARLGSDDPDITDPPIPIDEDYEIEFIIEVLPWYLVEQEVDL